MKIIITTKNTEKVVTLLSFFVIFAFFVVDAESVLAGSSYGQAGNTIMTSQANAQTPDVAGVAEPKVKPAFLPLPPGAVEPRGWLRDWAVTARDGLSGHMDEVSATFSDGWKGTPVNACRNFAQEHMLPYGVTSAEEWLSGIGAFRMTETCDVTAQLWSSSWMYRILGERVYGDGMERAFFNAGPGPVARDFKTLCYLQSPNKLAYQRLPLQPKTVRWVRFTVTKVKAGCDNVGLAEMAVFRASDAAKSKP